MALQLLSYISDHGAELSLPPPQCAWLWSPWCDAGPPLLDPTVVYKVPQHATDFLPDHHLIAWSAEIYTPRPETGVSVHDPYIPCNVRVLRVSGPCRNTTIFLSTGTKFSQSNWLVLIDNLRTRIDVARDNAARQSIREPNPDFHDGWRGRAELYGSDWLL